MVYECETCETILTPGLIVCPNCGQVFDEPVPEDARADETVTEDRVFAEEAERRPLRPNSGEPDSEKPVGARFIAPSSLAAPSAPVLIFSGSPELGRGGLTDALEPIPAPSDREAPPEIFAPVRRTHRRNSRGMAVAAVLLLAGAAWFGFRYWFVLPVSRPIMPTLPAPPTDLAAHPQYAANMGAFVQKLRATGVGAQWPAFRSNDVLLITPQPRVPEAPTAWDSNMYRRLAQGIYGQFAQNRYESGFSDTDTTACFVIVASASGQIMAVDFMGNLQ